jgi:hypothetical protein
MAIAFNQVKAPLDSLVPQLEAGRATYNKPSKKLRKHHVVRVDKLLERDNGFPMWDTPLRCLRCLPDHSTLIVSVKEMSALLAAEKASKQVGLLALAV